MKDPMLVASIVEATVKAIKKPVTVKIRKGFNDKNVNAVEIARIAEQSGAAAIAVHGRTREQYYSGEADWEIIRQVKEAVKIPVIGNGDVSSPVKARELTEQTGCDGIMIGRAVQGNPWIFSQTLSYLETGIIPAKPDIVEVLTMIRRHAKLQQQYKGEYIGIREMRKHLTWYLTGFPNSAKMRGHVNELTSFLQLEELLDTLIISKV